MKISVTVGGVLIAVGLIFFSLCSIFIIPPIGAIPEGRTLIIGRLTNVNFIDSADAICARQLGGVNLLCRAAVLGKVGSTATIYARLPYADFLYSILTDGVRYER